MAKGAQLARPSSTSPSPSASSKSPATKPSTSSFSPLSKALSITTNAVVSVQSIFGGKHGGKSSAEATANSGKRLVVSGDSRVSNQQHSNGAYYSSGNGSVRITNVLAAQPTTTQSRAQALAPSAKTNTSQTLATLSATIKAHQSKMIVPIMDDDTDEANVATPISSA
eukprot:GDKK01028501.1.p1 GENE.GDKK01028501.1~~GDKK01028501.1.p1  ORF type:complete len:168 (+),score=26.98 GDKK01028501.1:286-789(+)